MRTIALAVVIPILVLAVATPQARQATSSPATALRAAEELLKIKLDVRAAIVQYEKLIDSSDRHVAATALLGLGRCYELLGDGPKARENYAEVIRRFSDQANVAADAQRALEALKTPVAVPNDRLVAQLSGVPRLHWISADDVHVVQYENGRALGIRKGLSPQVTRLVQFQGVEHPLFPKLSFDGRYLIYTHEGIDSMRTMVLETTAAKAVPRVFASMDAKVTRVVARDISPDGASLLVERRMADTTWQLAWVKATGEVNVLKPLGWRRSESYGGPTSLSPDGRYVAYSALAQNPAQEDSGADTADRRIYVIASDGSREVEVTRTPGVNEFPIWTPDGTYLLFLSNRSGTSDLFAVRMIDGEPVGQPVLVRKNAPRTRPLGITAAGAYYYETTYGALATLSIADVPGAGSTARNPTLPYDLVGDLPSWSPDGTRLAYFRPLTDPDRSQLVVRTLDSGEEHRFSPPAKTNFADSPAAWMPDSQSLIVYMSTESNPQGTRGALYQADVRTGRLTEITAVPRFQIDRGPASLAVARDGRTVYIRGPMRRGPDPNQGAQNIIKCDLITGQETVLFPATEANAILNGLVLAPDGRSLAFLPTVAMPEIRQTIALLGVDGTGYRELTTLPALTGARFRWNPDGSLLAVERTFSGVTGKAVAVRLIRLDADSGRTEPLTIDATGVRSVDVSPNGAHLVLSRGKDITPELRAIENIAAAWKQAPPGR